MIVDFLELRFLGGAREKGRTAILMKGSSTILLDYGIKLHPKIEYPLSCGRVDACILSHAHADHSANVPFLYKDASPKVYGTAPTKELSKLLIEDLISDAKKNHRLNRFIKCPMPLFLNNYVKCKFDSMIKMGDYLICLKNAGHMSGSSITVMENIKTGKRLVYTGDFKLEPQTLQKGAEIVKSDILITESTHADRNHENRKVLIKKFIKEVKEVLELGGTVLMPTFVAGKAQELLVTLHKNNLSDYVSADTTTRKVTEIMLHHSDFMKNRKLLQQASERTSEIKREFDNANTTNEQNIILVTAGMHNGWSVLKRIAKIGPRPRIFLTGTKGMTLMQSMRDILKTPFTYHAFSLHADKFDLHEYVRKSNPETVICVHGDKRTEENFSEYLREKGFQAYMPNIGEHIKFNF